MSKLEWVRSRDWGHDFPCAYWARPDDSQSYQWTICKNKRGKYLVTDDNIDDFPGKLLFTSPTLKGAKAFYLIGIHTGRCKN